MADKANILFDEETANSLRDLAASLDFYTTRGPGAGEIGNIKALFDRLAQVYRQSPEVIRAMLLQLRDWHSKDAPDARPWIDLTCQHTWLADADEVPDICPICEDGSGQIHPVTDPRRVTGDRYRPYEGETIWTKMANRSLSLSAQEHFSIL